MPLESASGNPIENAIGKCHSKMPLQNAICGMPFENATGKCHWKMPLENAIENGKAEIGNFPPLIWQKNRQGAMAKRFRARSKEKGER